MKPTKKTVIFTDYNCNNRCIFCIDGDKRNLPPKSTTQIMAEIIDSKKRGAEYLEFIGGEVTIRQDVFKIIETAKKAGFSTIAMATNGRMISYPGFADKLAIAGLNHIIFSIHGHKAALHDSLTQVNGSFSQLIEGVKAVAVMKDMVFGSNTTIVKQNYKYLAEIGRLLKSLGIKNAEFIFVDPNSGSAYDKFDELVPRISEAAPYIRDCLDLGKGVSDHWHVRYVPLCYFTDYLAQISEIEEVKKFKTEHLAPDFKNFDVEVSRATVGRVKTEKCRGCILFGECEGIWREYINKYGDGELTPLKKQ